MHVSSLSNCHAVYTARQAAHTKEEQDKVQIAEADFLYANQDYEHAAVRYASSSLPFEDVSSRLLQSESVTCVQAVLKLVDCKSRVALKRYLRAKLERLDEEVSICSALILNS